MKQLTLVLAGLMALSACSEVRERREPVNDKVAQRPDLTLPVTVSSADTSLTLSSGSEQPVSPVEQQAPKAEPRPAKAKPPTPKKRRAVRTPSPAPKPESPPVDTTVQAYAPNAPADTSPTADSSRVADSAPASATVDSAPTGQVRIAAADITPSTEADTVAPASADTLAARTDTARPRARDSVVARLPDTTATTRDTTSTTATDTMLATASAAATTPSATSSASTAARTLAVGTEIHAALVDSITSRRDTVGQQVSAHVMENVKGPDGRTLIAAGTPVRFTVTRIRPSRSKNSQGRLALRADGIALNGQLRPVKAEIRPVPRELRGRGITGSEAAKVGGGAAAGAVIGGVVGGNTRGAVIGGVAGAAAGAVVASQTATRDVVVKSKTPVVLVLTAPLVAP